jgi:hypothetical protein
MKSWRVWEGYEYIMLKPGELKDIRDAIRYYDPKGKLVAVQVLRKTSELGQMKITQSSFNTGSHIHILNNYQSHRIHNQA